MEKFNIIQNAGIKTGDKITICKMGEFGGLQTVQTTFYSIEPKQHYQNCPESQIGVAIIHKPKRRKTYFKSCIDYNIPFVIYAGWIDIDTDKIVYDISIENGATYKKSKYFMHDKRYFDDLIQAYPNYIICKDI